MRAIPFLLLLGACAQADALPAPERAAVAPIAVHTAPVVTTALAEPVRGIGRVKAAEEVPLSFPFGGVVKTVLVDAGDHVRKGQVLAVLDAVAADAQLAQAESALAKAERDAERVTKLTDAGGLAPSTRQDATTGLEVARAQREAASFQARRSTLVAPADGVILTRYVEAEQTVGPGTPILSLASANGFELVVEVASADAVGLVPGTSAEVTVDALRGAPIVGRVTRRAGGAGPLGTWPVTISLDPVDGMASGLIGVATLSPSPQPWPTIPVTALAEADGDDGVVYTVSADGLAQRVPVRVAFLSGGQVALADAGGATQVITEGVAFVRDGAPVTVGGE